MIVSEWESFFLAQVGASAALTGLVFVALSINLTPIMRSPLLVGRAGEALLVLVTPVLVGLAVLMPVDTDRATGVACAIVAGIGWLAETRLLWRARAQSSDRPRREFQSRVVFAQTAMLPPIVGAFILIAGSTSGIYWIAFGAATAIVLGIGDAWVLLVEILR